MPQEEFQEQVDAPLLIHQPKLLAGKTALITGATRFNGIGFAIAERFALEGASPIILVGTHRSHEASPFLEARLQRYGTNGRVLLGDITKQDDCMELVERSYKICEGNVNILVNNAGTNRDLVFGTITPEDWEFIMKPKTLGALLMTQEWFRIRDQTNITGGRVINMGSVVGLHGNVGQEVYAMANAALIGLTKSQSVTLGKRGITVNLIAPGFVEGTNMTANLEPDQMELSKTVSAVRELIKPEDIASVALHLAGPGGEKITGAVLSIDCGIQSNYLGARKLHQAGFRQIPRRLMKQVTELLAGERK